jgi:hypothetical protein
MAEPDFSATGVQIGKWLRPVTRAGQVLISDGRLRLLTSKGAEIDSAPVERVHAGVPWFGARGSAHATVNGTRYLISIDDEAPAAASSQSADGHSVRGFLDALRRARHT